MTGGRYDVCVCGGGIIGLAIAYELARRGASVAVLERDTIGATAAAGVAAGMLAPHSEADVAHRDLTALAVASHELYPTFIHEIEEMTGLSTGFDQAGTLYVAAGRDHLAQLVQLDAFQRERGLKARRLSGPEARDLEPALSPAVSAGLLLEDDWQVDPRRLMRTLATAISRLGGSIREGVEVTGVCQETPGYRVHTGEGDRDEAILATNVVLATGAWVEGIRRGGPPLPLRPVRGEILRLRGERLLRRVVRSPDVYLVPRDDGELVVGATSEERGFDDRLFAGSVLDLLRDAYRLTPGIYDMELAESRVGFRPALRDHLPAIGRLDDRGLYVATGHFRNGVELAPITARLLADVLLDGATAPLLGAFDPGRFALGPVTRAGGR